MPARTCSFLFYLSFFPSESKSLPKIFIKVLVINSKKKNLFTKMSVCQWHWAAAAKNGRTKNCMLFISAACTFPPSPVTKKYLDLWFSLMLRYPWYPLFSSHRMGDYGQSQSARGQSWSGQIKTHHLITSLLTPSRHQPIRARHFWEMTRSRCRRWSGRDLFWQLMAAHILLLGISARISPSKSSFLRMFLLAVAWVSLWPVHWFPMRFNFELKTYYITF